MLRCERCERIIENNEVIYEKIPAGECFGISQYETEERCPHCGYPYLVEVEQCENCGEWFEKGELMDGLCDECGEEEEKEMDKKAEILERLSSMVNDFRGLMKEYREAFNSCSPTIQSESIDFEKANFIHNEPSIACFSGEWEKVSEIIGGEETEVRKGELNFRGKMFNGVLFYTLDREEEEEETF